LFCLVSASHTLLFATDFRADSLAVALLIVGFAALHRDDTSRRVVVAGSLLGLALLVTLKSIFYAPVFLFFIVRRGFQTALTFLAAAAGSFISAFLFHRSILSGSASDSAWFVETAERFLSFGPEPAVLYHLLQSVNRDFPLWSMVGFGGFLLVLFVLKGHGGKGADLWAFLFLLLPLACYRNVYPYFFWFLWPGLSLLAGILAEVMPSGRQRVAVVLLLVGVSLVRAIPFISLQLKDTILPQQQVLEVVHSAFPEPVPYLDRASMVSSFPSAGFFMTSYHLERYIQGKERTLEQIVTGSGAEFLIANTPGLDLRLPYEEAVFTRGIQLTNSDWDFLKREFRHYWGPIFIRKDSLLSDKNFIAPQAAPPSEPLFLGFF